MRFSAVALSLFLSLSLVGCDFDNVRSSLREITDAVGDVEVDHDDRVVYQILMGTALDEEGKLSERTAVFAPSDRDFHVHVFFSQLDSPLNIVGSWWILPEPPEGQELVVETASGVQIVGSDEELPAGQKIYEIPVAINPDLPVAKFHLKNTEDWPVGRYRFEVLSEGEKITEVPFAVVEGAKEWREIGL